MTILAGKQPDGTPAVHLRTQVTHNNLSDSRWKPNIWWRITSSGELSRTQLFSQGSRCKHQVLLCQCVPEMPVDLCESDAEAVALARYATNFAYFSMIYRIALKRRAGLHTPNGTVEIPIDLMNVYSLADDAVGVWGQAMEYMGLTLRVIGLDNQLHELRGNLLMNAVDPLDVRSTPVCPNYLSIGQAYRLGISVTMGAEKMSMYLAEMNDVITAFLARIGETCRTPQFVGVSQVDINRLAPLPDSQIPRKHGKSSLPLLAAHHGAALRGQLDKALDQAVSEAARRALPQGRPGPAGPGAHVSPRPMPMRSLVSSSCSAAPASRERHAVGAGQHWLR